MLAWTIYLSFFGMAVLMLLPADRPRAARMIAMGATLAGLAFAVSGVLQYRNHPPADTILTITQVTWLRSLGLQYFLAADGISLTLVLLTGIVAVAGTLFSWNVEHRTKEFFAFYLALIGGVYGVFLSFDLFLLFVFYEIAIIPKYFLIAIWGSARGGGSKSSAREYAAMKLALYSFVGSAMVLVGM